MEDSMSKKMFCSRQFNDVPGKSPAAGHMNSTASRILKRFNQHSQVIEQLGTYDPLGNQYNERLVALNFERVRHWLGRGADTSYPVAELLGLCGFFPIHPRCYMSAWRNRKAAETEAAAQEAKSEGQEKT
ncbi:probable 28S ribosomal protein S16, mitochondrial isoform X2 [Zootermopsis nevadensis]|uniref:probable 28S ribosomal protein S16, mitochondrial isoform X2 n=1 Tax=Zootermopsis nevadensis TaxID=136037 RepID=UPI000B8E360B|nr:probable 28S ribosomal protein S16, mitochondrial isoform X2 [Zootermopsis nevadensis]